MTLLSGPLPPAPNQGAVGNGTISGCEQEVIAASTSADGVPFTDAATAMPGPPISNNGGIACPGYVDPLV